MAFGSVPKEVSSVITFSSLASEPAVFHYKRALSAGTVNEVMRIFGLVVLSLLLETSPCLSWSIVAMKTSRRGCFSSLPPFRWQRRVCRLTPKEKTVIFADPSSSTSMEKSDVIVKGITLKIALDSTGAAADLAADKSERFTCAESLDMVHRLRRDSDAVLVGRRTIEVDNPSLTVRRNYTVDRQPLRVVLDPLLKLAPQADRVTVLTDGLPTVVYHSVPDVDESLLDLQDSVRCVYMPDFDLTQIVQHLQSEFGVQHLMVEGGPYTARLFLPLLDRVLIVKAPLCFRDPLSAGVTAEILQEKGFQFLGSVACGVDTIEYWSKSGLPWPTEVLGDWP